MGAEDPAQSPADCACRLTGNNQVNAVGPRVFENIRPVCRDQKGTHGGLHFKSRALPIFAFTKCPIPPDHRQAGERGAIHPWLPGCWSWRLLLVKPCPLLVIKNKFVEKYRGYRRFDHSFRAIEHGAPRWRTGWQTPSAARFGKPQRGAQRHSTSETLGESEEHAGGVLATFI